MLSHAEVRAILAAVRNPIHRTCFELMYACGLRIGEAAKVEISDIENTKGVLRIIARNRYGPPVQASSGWARASRR